MQGLAHVVLVQIHHRLAVRALIACVDQRIQRERIVVGRGDFFFDKRAQNAGLGGGEQDWLGGGIELFSHALCHFLGRVSRLRVSRK